MLGELMRQAAVLATNTVDALKGAAASFVILGRGYDLSRATGTPKPNMLRWVTCCGDHRQQGEWSMVMTDAGDIGDIIDIRNAIAKRASVVAFRCTPACNRRWLNCGTREAPNTDSRVEPRRGDATEQHRQLVRDDVRRT